MDFWEIGILTGFTLLTVGFIAVFMKFPVYNTIGGGGGDGSHNMHEVYIVTTEVHNAGSHDFFFHFVING